MVEPHRPQAPEVKQRRHFGAIGEPLEAMAARAQSDPRFRVDGPLYRPHHRRCVMRDENLLRGGPETGIVAATREAVIQRTVRCHDVEDSRRHTLHRSTQACRDDRRGTHRGAPQ